MTVFDWSDTNDELTLMLVAGKKEVNQRYRRAAEVVRYYGERFEEVIMNHDYNT